MEKNFAIIFIILIAFISHAHADSCAYFSPKDNISEKIIALINKTTNISTIKVAVYQLTSKSLSDALINALKRKVSIKIITDQSTSKANSSKIKDLQKEGAEIFVFIPPAKYSGIIKPLMHHKFALFDFDGKEQILEEGSFNWTKSANELNCEHITITSGDKKLYQSYEHQFEELQKQCKRKGERREDQQYFSQIQGSKEGMLPKITSFLHSVRKALGNA